MAVFASAECVVGFVKLGDDSGLLARAGGEGEMCIGAPWEVGLQSRQDEELNAFDQGLWGGSKAVVYEIFGVGRSVEHNPATRKTAIAKKKKEGKKDIVHNYLNLDLECSLVKSTKDVHEFGYVLTSPWKDFQRSKTGPSGDKRLQVVRGFLMMKLRHCAVLRILYSPLQRGPYHFV